MKKIITIFLGSFIGLIIAVNPFLEKRLVKADNDFLSCTGHVLATNTSDPGKFTVQITGSSEFCIRNSRVTVSKNGQQITIIPVLSSDSLDISATGIYSITKDWVVTDVEGTGNYSLKLTNPAITIRESTYYVSQTTADVSGNSEGGSDTENSDNDQEETSDNDSTNTTASGLSTSAAGDLIQKIVTGLYYVALPIAVVIAIVKILLAIMKIAVSSGDPNAINEAKDEAYATLMGLLVIAGAVTLITMLGSALGL